MTTSETYFKIFCRISRAMQKTFEMDRLLHLIVKSAVEAMNAKACSLFLKDRKQNLFNPVAQQGLSEAYVHTNPNKALDMVKDLVNNGGYILIEDATTDPRVEDHEAKKREGIGSILVVPVITDEKTIGILSLYTAEKVGFSDQDIEFLSSLADQGGMAIQKARFIDRKKKNAELLVSLAEDLNSSLDIRHILHIMSAEIAEAFNFKAVGIRLLDEDRRELKLVSSYGLSEAYINKGPVYAESLRQSLANGAENLNNMNTGRVEYFNEKKAEGIVSILNLPITVKEEVIGIMKVYCDAQREFPEDVVSLLTSVARLGGLAIQNASMYLELKEDKENLEKEIWSHKAWF